MLPHERQATMTPDELRSLRIKLNLSQAALAKLLGRATATINRWENGLSPMRKWLDLVDWPKFQQPPTVAPRYYLATDRHGRKRIRVNRGRLVRQPLDKLDLMPRADEPHYNAWLRLQETRKRDQ